MVLHPTEDSDGQQIETSAPPRASVGRFQKWIRSIVTTIMLALPIGNASAQEKQIAPQQIEEVITMTEKKVKELLGDFDDNKFSVRDAAKILMQDDIDAWYKKKAEGYPHKKSFVGQNWSLEKTLRAGALFNRCDQHELDHMWTSETQIEIPEAWSTRGPRAGEVLDLIGQQTGRRFESYAYDYERKFQLQPIQDKTMPYWKLLEYIESASHRPFHFWDNITGRRIATRSFAKVQRAHHGPLIANLEMNSSSVELIWMAEPKISWPKVFVREATLILPDGSRQGLDYEVQNMFHCSFMLPQMQKKTTATLEVKASIDAYRMKMFTIRDPLARQQLETRICSFTFDGPNATTWKDPSKRTWQGIPFELSPLQPRDTKTMDYYWTASATDTDPYHCTSWERKKWEGQTLHGTVWYIGDPKDSMIRLPDIPTHREVTSTFHNISLPHMEKE